MDESKYVGLLYKPIEVNGLMIVYYPQALVSGEYDVEKSEFTSGEYTMKILSSDSLQTASSDLNKEVFIGFPTPIEDTSLYKDPEDKTETDVQTLLENYASYITSYGLISMFNTESSEHSFFLMDSENQIALRINDLSSPFQVVLQNAEAAIGLNFGMIPNGANVQIINYNLGMDYLDDLLDYGEMAEPASEKEGKTESEIIYDFDPEELAAKVKDEVKGQDEAIDVIVNTIYNNMRYRDIEGLKSNIMILGPTGCGKTQIIKSIAKHLNIPFTKSDASSVTEQGIVGSSATQCLRDLIAACGGDIKKAEHGIVFIDEWDKIAQQSGEKYLNEGVQDEYLTMMNGDIVTIPAESFMDSSKTIDTSHITFITAGAFSELLKKRKKSTKPLGFVPVQVKEGEKPKEITVDELEEFGMRPEIIGRQGVVVEIRELTRDDLIDIISNSSISNLRLWQKAYELTDHVKVVTDEGYIERVADKSTAQHIGARGIEKVVNISLRDVSKAIRLLKGKPGELVLKKETVDDPTDFELYRTYPKKAKKLVYKKEVKE